MIPLSFKGVLRISALLIILMIRPSLVSAVFSSQAEAGQVSSSPAFQPGEILEYEVSWSKVLKAGTAVMEVREDILSDGKQILNFILTGRSSGLVDRFFPVNDRVLSVFDPESMQSLAYTITENFGKKKRRQTLVFDREQDVVVNTLNDDPPQTVAVPEQVQDGLAALYYLRSKNQFTVGNVFAINVHDSGKNWSLEVHTLGRETVKTDAGEFSTIMVKTRPLYNGVFLNKGELFIWLTDDNRKIPVVMKSKIKIGSFVFRLKGMKPGAAQVDLAGASDL